MDWLERYHGRVADEIAIALWSITQAADDSEESAGDLPAGSSACPGMQTRGLGVDGRGVETDSEGYLGNPADWSASFARTQAEAEHQALTDEHRQPIRYLRAQFARTGTQASVRDMIKHFRQVWGLGRRYDAHLHRLFPRGGPQKQGNGLAGRLRTMSIESEAATYSRYITPIFLTRPFNSLTQRI